MTVRILRQAALFSPGRRRVQRRVDRRFNRARYDADQTVAAFAARLKDAVDLDTIREDLARVVEGHWNPPTSRCGPAGANEIKCIRIGSIAAWESRLRSAGASLRQICEGVPRSPGMAS